MDLFCCLGKADKRDAAGPPARVVTTTKPVQRVWQRDGLWETQFATVNTSEGSEQTMKQRVRKYVDALYPQCARVGSIEDTGESRARLRDGNCSPHTHNTIVVLDDNFTGIVYSFVLVVNLPPDADLTPGKWLESLEMDEAKFLMFQMLEAIEKQGTNVKHAVARVFIGNDAFHCKYYPENIEPTIQMINGEFDAPFRLFNDEMARMIHQMSDVPKGAFRSFHFEHAVQDMYERHPGCTVWDEGPFTFNVKGKPFQDATRLLVARQFHAQPGAHFIPDDEVEAITYRLTKNGDPEASVKPPLKLLQSRQPGKLRRGVVAITVIVATPMGALWYKSGAYAKSQQMQAAVIAAKDLTEVWNKRGKIHACTIAVHMGADLVRFKFVSQSFCSHLELQESKEQGISDPVLPSFPPLDGFYVDLKQEADHGLFDSEVQFQAIKQLMRQRAQEDPDRFRAMAPIMALVTAQHFLEANYSGSSVVDEGECPIAMEGLAYPIPDTHLVIAKNPTKETNNVLAAILAVPNLGGETMTWAETCDKVWIETPEMKAAEEALRKVLVQWYEEGKLADDCMAQVLMGTDATIYRFVDGERFEDYPEEMQKQFIWG